MAYKIITNNLKVYQKYENSFAVEFVDADFISVLIRVRNLIHDGAKLITHPLSGSVKPGETPYKSVVVDIRCREIDYDSLYIIEDSIATSEKFLNENRLIKGYRYTEKVLEDFREIDLTLICNALEGRII